MEENKKGPIRAHSLSQLPLLNENIRLKSREMRTLTQISLSISQLMHHMLINSYDPCGSIRWYNIISGIAVQYVTDPLSTSPNLNLAKFQN